MADKRTIHVEGDYFEYVAGNVYTGTVIIQRNGREIQLPLQRPPRAEFFTDRKEELAQLLHDLQPGRVVTLCGSGGIGKTALAAEAIWRLADEKQILQRFPDGILFHSFYARPDVNLALEHIATSFGAEPKPTPEIAALQVLAGKRALLFLDGTEEASDLRAILNVRGECGVIVTSRRRKDAVAERQNIESLQSKDAIKLLQAWGKAQAADEAAIQQICGLVGGLPLAIRLVGRYLAETGDSAAEYLGWLEKTPLDALDQGERKQQSVPLLLKRSLNQVSEPARQVLGLFSVLAFAPVSRDVVSAALPQTSVRRPLNELVNYGLLHRTGERYEVSHALIHTYARRRMTVEAEALQRLAAYYKRFANEQSQQGLTGYARLDTERAHILQVLEGFQKQQQWQAATDLIWAVQYYLYIRGHWTEEQTALEMGVEAARQSEHRRDEEAFLRMMGLACNNLGQVEQAITLYQQALVICRESGHRQDEGAVLNNLGLVYYDLGQVEKAIEYYELALAIVREIGDRQNEGRWLGNLGLAYSALGQVEKAIEYYELALAIAREIGDREGEGADLGNLALAYHGLGQVEKAIEYHELALAIDREIGRRQGEGIRLGNLGLAYSDLGQVDKAIEYYEQALDTNREIGYRQGEGANLDALGLAYSALEQVDKAIEYYEQALVINREIGYRQGEGVDLGNLGIAYRALGQVDKAKQYLREALSIFEEIKSPYAEDARKQLAELEGKGSD